MLVVHLDWDEQRQQGRLGGGTEGDLLMGVVVVMQEGWLRMKHRGKGQKSGKVGKRCNLESRNCSGGGSEHGFSIRRKQVRAHSGAMPAAARSILVAAGVAAWGTGGGWRLGDIAGEPLVGQGVGQ